VSLDRPHAILFPAALVLGAAVAPLKLLELGGGLYASLPHGWHGHEMLLGMATAIIAGYLLPARRPGLLAALLLAWAAARLTVLAPVTQPVALLAGLSLWPLLMGAITAKRFLKGAKTARNLVFVPILLGFLPAEILYAAGISGWLTGGVEAGLGLAAGLVLLMLFTMGGRIIAAASSGAHQRLGGRLRRAAQPRLEALGLLAILLLIVAMIVDAPVAAIAVAALASGLVVLARLGCWRVWALIRLREVALLHLGYGALGAGLLFAGWAIWSGRMPALSALHPAMIGGFGILAVTMMLRTTLQRARRPLAMTALPGAATVLLLLSAMGRAYAGVAGDMGAMALSAGGWSLALLIALVALWRI